MKKAGQPLWQRIILLSVLAYEAMGCLLGGAMLIIAPDGRLMDMPVDLMRGAFSDFLVPGIILFGLGVLNTFTFISVFRKREADWLMSGFALGGLAIWFWIEIAILQELHWLHAMWGLPVVVGAIASISLFRKNVARKILLICGILSSLLYVAINVIVPIQWPAYSSITQTVSELSAVGAPTRMLWIVLCAPYSLLVIAFALGVRKVSEKTRLLRIVGNLLLIYGLLSILWPFAPMHLRETLAAGGGTSSDTMHIALAVVTEIIFVAALSVAAVALGKQFRTFSAFTLLSLLVFGVLTFLESPNIATNQPTPMIGIWERINIGIFLLWVAVLAVVLLQNRIAPHQE